MIYREREISDHLNEISAEGNRFVINLVYEKTPAKTDITAARNVRTMPIGRVIPPSEEDTVPVKVNLHNVNSLRIIDKSEPKEIDPVRLLPEGWKIHALTLHEELLELARRLGTNPDDPKVKAMWAYNFYIAPTPNDKIVLLPIYKLMLEDKPRIDQTAEQIVYAIGLALASPSGIGNFSEAHRSARKYLRQTLGGDLKLLQAKF